MRSFVLHEHRRFVSGGKTRIHARLKALRGQDWSVIGFFDVTEEEWDALVRFAHVMEIEVTHNVEIAALPS